MLVVVETLQLHHQSQLLAPARPQLQAIQAATAPSALAALPVAALPQEVAPKVEKVDVEGALLRELTLHR
jgi:hypothetical protein